MPRPTRSRRDVREILAIPARQRSPEQVGRVFSYWRTTVPEWNGANAWIDSLGRQHPEGSSQLVLRERDKSREPPTSCSGAISSSRARRSSRACRVPEPLAAAGDANAADVRAWLASRDSPTTARSLVNRVWQAYFGTGIVATSEDLGLQCDAAVASRAARLAGGRIHGKRLEPQALAPADRHLGDLPAIVAVTAPLLARDPYNRLLARGPRFRVDAELVRDIALAASGLLDPKIGGPSVCPPAPAFLFQPPTSYGPKVWNEATGPERYRRAFYTFRYRSVPYPMLQAFDAPNGDFACVRRTRSNTPLQALTTLNEPIYLECARALALRTLGEGGSTDADRLVYAFRRCLARRRARPRRRPCSICWTSRRGGSRRREPIPGPWRPTTRPSARSCRPARSRAELAGWTAVARVLLNLDETITKE